MSIRPNCAPGFGGMFKSEIIQLISLHQLLWLLVIDAFLFPALAALIVYFQMVPSTEGTFVLWWPGADITFCLIGGMQVSYLLIPCVVAIAVGSGGAGGFVMQQIVSEPRRVLHVCSKAVIYGGVVFVLSLVCGGVAVFVGRWVLYVNDQIPDSTIGDAVGVVVRMSIVLLLLTWFALGVSYAVRKTGLALAVMVSFLLIAPVILTLMPGLDKWSAVLPSIDMERFVFPWYDSGILNWMDPGKTGALGILGCWVVVAVLLGGCRYCFADCERPQL
ncbi:MAG: hypothetical protein LBC29_06105 [Propionibacteriaceae bacterium]|jgi:hypothetical protein|nr:hypothetical protein [Propionibacteriaceae bacterium]